MVQSWLTNLGIAVARAVILFLPALTANAMPVILRNLFKRAKLTPLDKGKLFLDGERILGDSKSIEGFIAGTVGGSLIGLAYGMYTDNYAWLIYGLLMGLGTMFGDLLNSFIKRRLKIKPGDPFIPFDQLSFLYVSYALVSVSGVTSNLEAQITLADLATGTYIVLVLHPLSNLIAYLLGLKDKPW